jgi:hypothetical protein
VTSSGIADTAGATLGNVSRVLACVDEADSAVPEGAL